MKNEYEKYEKVYKELKVKGFSFSTVADALDQINSAYWEYLSQFYPPSFVFSPHGKNYQNMYIGLSVQKVKNIATIDINNLNDVLGKEADEGDKLNSGFQAEVFKFISDYRFSDKLFTVGVVKSVFRQQGYLCVNLIKSEGLPRIKIKGKKYKQKKPKDEKDKKVAELVSKIVGVEEVPKFMIVLPVYDSPSGYLLGFIHMYFEKGEKRKEFIKCANFSAISEQIRDAYFSGKVEDKVFSFEDELDVIEYWEKAISELFYWDKVEWERGDRVELYAYDEKELKINVLRFAEELGFRNVPLVGDREILSLSVCKGKEKEFFEFRLKRIKDLLYKLLQRWEWLQMHKMQVYHSIMTNNKRHNITGHVILRNNFYKGNDREEHKKFDMYLSVRDSFIALATSGITLPYAPVFSSELTLPFEEDGQSLRTPSGRQNLLVDGILSFFGREGLKIENKVGKNYLIAVPGGSTGMHAFYIILENIISNSAKYGNKTNKEIQLTVELNGEDVETIGIKVYSNLDVDKNGEILRNICKVMNEKIIDYKTGAPAYTKRGMHEMKFCAGFLLGFDRRYYFNNGGKKVPLLVKREENKIVYYLKLLKFIQVEENNLRSDPFIFVVTKEHIIEEVRKNRKKYPNRVIFVTNKNGDFESYKDEGIITLSESEYKESKNHFLKLYELWIKKFFDVFKNGKKIELLVCFNKETKESWNRDLIKRFKSDIIELKKFKIDSGNVNKIAGEIKNNYISYEDHNILMKSLGNEEEILKKNISRVTFGSKHTFILNPPQEEFFFNFFVLSLVESALTKIYIADERIEEKLSSEVELNELPWNKALIYTRRDNISNDEKFHFAVYHLGLQERGEIKRVKAVYEEITSIRVINKFDERFVDLSAIYEFCLDAFEVDKYHLAQLVFSAYSKQKGGISLP